MLLWLAAACIPLAAAQINDLVDWASYLARADPVWDYAPAACTPVTGYTQVNHTIRYGSVDCPGVSCSSAAACPDQAASVCDACTGCFAFGLCPAWHNGTTPQFWGNTTSSANQPWTTWVKGGPALANHSSCLPDPSSGPLPTAWEDGAFVGNGLNGGILLAEPSAPHRALRLDAGRTDVWDRRDHGTPGFTGAILWDKPRLPLGYVALATAGNITHVTYRLRLHTATLAGVVTTTAGSVTFELVAHYTRLSMFLQWNATGGEAPSAAGVGGFSATFVPIQGNATRQNPPAGYLPNPVPECAGDGWAQAAVCTQALLAGGNYATALRSQLLAPGQYVTVWHTANDAPGGTSPATAEAAVAAGLAAVTAAGWAAACADHAAWWAAYWPVSFLTLPDTVMEAMYVIQIYKMATAARPGGVAIDLHGPWFQKTGWPIYWFDVRSNQPPRNAEPDPPFPPFSQPSSPSVPQAHVATHPCLRPASLPTR